MIDKPTIVQSNGRPAAVIRITIPRTEIQRVMGPGITELMSTLAAQGIAPAGPLFSHHLRLDPDVFDFELGVPVEAPVAAAGRVRPGELPAATVARTVYRGPYEGLGPAWEEFDAWIAAEGRAPAADFWESYLTGPDSSPDPAVWRTELTRRLAL
jgi:effector-binding domain-containing protein